MFEMGGYASYIWPAYGLTIVAMVLVLLVSLRAMKKNEGELKLLQASRPRRAGRAAALSETETSDS